MKRLLGDTIHQVRTGQIDPKIANCVGYLSGILLRTIEVGDIEERLAAMEAVVGGQHGGRRESDFDRPLPSEDVENDAKDEMTDESEHTTED